jgi:hypothetical protein
LSFDPVLWVYFTDLFSLCFALFALPLYVKYTSSVSMCKAEELHCKHINTNRAATGIDVIDV